MNEKPSTNHYLVMFVLVAAVVLVSSLVGGTAFTGLATKKNSGKNVTGNFYVSTAPPEAKLYVDDSFRGIAPLKISGLKVGMHKVRVSKEGYQDYNRSVIIAPGKVTKISVKLKQIRTGK